MMMQFFIAESSSKVRLSDISHLLGFKEIGTENETLNELRQNEDYVYEKYEYKNEAVQFIMMTGCHEMKKM